MTSSQCGGGGGDCTCVYSEVSVSSFGGLRLAQVLMKFMEILPQDGDYITQLMKKLAPPLGECLFLSTLALCNVYLSPPQ